MKKYYAIDLSEQDGPMRAPVYRASDVDARIAELRGALADIAFSEDMTLEVARAKAKRIYEATAS
jgi:hypothetical protein